MKLYVGCGLTQAPEEFRLKVENLKKKLKESYELFDFIGLVDGTPQDVYNWDIHECLQKCDVFVAICDFPAIGLGYEIGVAVEKLEKPTLALVQKDVKVTRLLEGIEQPRYKLVRYDNIDQVPKLVELFISGLQ